MARISASPDPVAPGGTLTICYEFDPGQTEADLDLDYDYADGSHSHDPMHLTVDEPCQTRIVPLMALGLLISEDAGIAQDVAVTVQP